MWWILIIVGVLLLIGASIAQASQPQRTFWERWKSTIFGFYGGAVGGGAVAGLQSLGIAIFGTAVGLPVVAVTAVLGGLAGPTLGKIFGEDTYGGKWQTSIDIGYGLGLGLTLAGIVFKVAEWF